MIILILGLLAAASAGPVTENKETYKDQYCTDPRTLRNHAAYTEWADAYSCTRHRCQPGGRNLAIYTVGCKRVEAPESAIECEEVVEDTNMQFPYCCTRLRCLVVVRGEVWTRVLGQPWEVLPAAPWSHMYKIKKPPPPDASFLPKTEEQGPIYELSEPEADGGGKGTLRSSKKDKSDKSDCNNEVVPRSNPSPDIVIALSTNNEVKESSYKIYENTKNRRSQTRNEKNRHKRARKTASSVPNAPSTPITPSQYFEEEQQERERDRERRMEPEVQEQELEELPNATEKPPEASEESMYANSFTVTEKPTHKNPNHIVGWTEIPHDQWNEHDGMDVENQASEPSYRQPELHAQEAAEPKKTAVKILTKEKKSGNLQALVDAIGSRMKDIEHVVQKMSDKVHHDNPKVGEESNDEKRPPVEQEGSKNHMLETKRPNTEDEHYQRFAVRNRISKYLHSKAESTTEQPLFIEDTNLNGYFSDASNSVLRRSQPKEPALTYMAPVESRRKTPAHIKVVTDNNSDEIEKKRKKHTHKKRRNKGAHTRNKKHHSKNDKRKTFNRLNLSSELEKNNVSFEDSSALVN